jgi:phospholipid/cholesterol/gamma-HCH transport system substrate-binding protein
MKISKEARIGIIFTLALLLFIWGLNFLRGKNLLINSNVYYGVYKNVKGLTEANPVMVNGYQVGQVESIDFFDANADKLVVKISLNKRFRVPVNSVAEIFSPSLMGTKAVNIILNDTLKYHKEGDTLISQVEIEFTTRLQNNISPLTERIENVTQALDEFISEVFDEQSKDNLSQSFKNIRHSTGHMNDILKHEKEKIAAITSNLKDLSYALKESNDEITLILSNFSAISDSIANSQIKHAIDNTSLTISEMKDILNKINKAEGTIGQLVNNDSLYRNLEHSSKELNNLIIDLQENPQRYIQFSVFGNKNK